MSDKDRFDDFLERYSLDRKETTDRYNAERQERIEWRNEIKSCINDLDAKISPVVRDHQIITSLGKWFLGLGSIAASGLGIVKAWDFIREHFK